MEVGTLQPLRVSSVMGDDYLRTNFSLCDKIKLLVLIFFYTIDIVSDVYLAYIYCTGGDWFYFGYTVVFILVAPLYMVYANIRDFFYPRRSSSSPLKTGCCFAVRIIFTLLFPLAVYLRFFQYWIYRNRFMQAKSARNRDKAQKYYDLMNDEWRIVSFIRLREAFLEAAPQLSLHLYIIAKEKFAPIVQAFSFHIEMSRSERFFLIFRISTMLISLATLAWTLASTRPLLRSVPATEAQEQESTVEKDEETTWLGTAILTLAHLLGIGARCVALSVMGGLVWYFAGAHIIIFFIVLWKTKTNLVAILSSQRMFSYNKHVKRITKFFSMVLLAAISVFSYTHSKRGFSHGYYMLICLAENIFMFGGYFYRRAYGESGALWIGITLLSVHVALFALSGLCFVFFYKSEREINKWANNVSKCLPTFDSCEAEAKNEDTELESNSFPMQPIQQTEGL